MAILEVKDLKKSFGDAEVLKGISFSLEEKNVLAIIGSSGSGKTTLLRCINMLERPTEGEVIVNGQRLDTMTPAQLRAARREITMIFQRFNLLMQRTCLKNVCFPMELVGVKKAEAEERARQLLELVGLPDKADAYPAQLSGGQQQRVAIARALITKPAIVLADEPTGNLDSKTSTEVLGLIKRTSAEFRQTVVMITHNNDIARLADRIVRIEDGKIVE